MRKNEKDLAREIYEQFENATAYIDALSLKKDIKRCVSFEEGDQWVQSEEIKDFPKVTLNITKQVGKVRKSAILQNEYSYLVDADTPDNIRKIQDFLKFLSQKLKLKKVDLKVVNDDWKKGTGICYFYWDDDSRSFYSKSGGQLKAEVVDIRNFRVSDPYVQEIQDQEWVMFATRERRNAVEDKYGVKIEAMDTISQTIDTEKNVISRDEQDEFINVYTKFYRNEDGEVHFVISTEFQILKKATALNYKYQGSKKEEPSTLSTTDEKVEKEAYKGEAFGLYPFAVFVSNERDNCFYGIPGARELLDANKSINNHFSVFDKATQDNVLGGFVMKKGVLGDQEITTDNGQILELELMPGEKVNENFGRIPVNNIPTDSFNYANNLMGVVRQVSGASNVQIGQSDFAGQSGKQTQMLLERAKENSSDIAMLFNSYKEDQAAIMFLFAKFFYTNEDFVVVEHGSKKDKISAYDGENVFNGNEYIDKDINISIKVGAAASFSEYASIELLGWLAQTGQIPASIYLLSLPDGYVNNRDELLEVIDNNNEKMIEKLQQDLEQAKQVMQQMSTTYQQMQKKIENVDTVINENQRLKSQMAEISANAIKMAQKTTQEKTKLTEEMQNVLNIVKNRI